MRMQAKEAHGPGLRSVQLDMEFESSAGTADALRGPPRRRHARGTSSHFARQDAVEETWRVVQPLIDSPPPVEVYEPELGPASAEELTRDHEAGGTRGCRERRRRDPDLDDVCVATIRTLCIDAIQAANLDIRGRRSGSRRSRTRSGSGSSASTRPT